ncbi:MAG: TIM barrel protein [Chthonomonadales bacterium]
MKLGIMIAGKRAEDIRLRIEQAREAGFSLCQLNLLQSGFTRSDLVQIADALSEFDVRPVAVGCYVNPLRPDHAGPMGATRADLDTLLHALDLIGARKVVLWSGSYADGPFDMHDDNHSVEAFDILGDFLADVVRKTKTRHYYLCIEPYFAHVINSEKKAVEFHEELQEVVREKVRFVIDAPSLLTDDRYAARDTEAHGIIRKLAPLAGVSHLRDCVMPPDGDYSLPGPGLGSLDYAAYINALMESAPHDTCAIARSVPYTEFADCRDFLLRSSDKWELA